LPTPTDYYFDIDIYFRHAAIDEIATPLADAISPLFRQRLPSLRRPPPPALRHFLIAEAPFQAFFSSPPATPIDAD
jgi:hypothetical protein